MNSLTLKPGSTSHSVRLESRPPYFSGQATTDHPASNRILSQSLCSSNPSGVSIDLSGSAGLQRLREELFMRVSNAAAPTVVRDVLFREMLIQ